MPEDLAIDVDIQPFLHLRAGGVSVVVDLSDRRLPTVRHWGADLGVLTDDQLRDLIEATRPPLGDSPMDVADQITVVPEHAQPGWAGPDSRVDAPGATGRRRSGWSRYESAMTATVSGCWSTPSIPRRD